MLLAFRNITETYIHNSFPCTESCKDNNIAEGRTTNGSLSTSQYNDHRAYRVWSDMGAFLKCKKEITSYIIISLNETVLRRGSDQEFLTRFQPEIIAVNFITTI